MFGVSIGIMDGAGGAGAVGDYDSISTSTVGAGGVSSVTFSSIPSSYTHLQVRIMCLSSNLGSDIKLQLNSDTGSNYAQHLLYGTGAVAGALAYTSTNYIAAGITGITLANPSSTVIDVLDYKNTNKNTTVRTLTGSDTNGVGGFLALESGLWMNTAAVTSMTFTPLTGTFNQYSSFALYGIKG
jgi:hypothetical protein